MSAPAQHLAVVEALVLVARLRDDWNVVPLRCDRLVTAVAVRAEKQADRVGAPA